MRYAAIRPIDVSNGEGLGVALFIQGCSIHCKGCFQPETWDFNGGEKFTQETMATLFEYLDHDYIKRFSILGGEPLEDRNLFELANLIYLIKTLKPKLHIWLYTGYTTEQLRQRLKEEKEVHYLKMILETIDVLVAGPFIEEEKDLGLKWSGSRNQTVIYFNKGH